MNKTTIKENNLSKITLKILLVFYIIISTRDIIGDIFALKSECSYSVLFYFLDF